MKKKKCYANAKDVLPEELFEQIQKHYTGILWVPAPSRFYKERRDLVLALHLQGISSQEISNLAGVTTRRVNQIIAAERKNCREQFFAQAPRGEPQGWGEQNRTGTDSWPPLPVSNP